MQPIKETAVKTRRKFDQTFKREAVQNWLASGKSAEVIAQELGLDANRLYAWKKRFAPLAPGGGRQPGRSPAPSPTCKASWLPPGGKSPGSPNSATY